MKRWPRVLTLVTIAGAALLALAWLRSYWVSDGVFWKDKRLMLRVMSSRGRVLGGYWRSVGTQDFPQVGIGYTRRLPGDLAEMTVRPDTGTAPDWRWSRLGIVLERDQGSIERGQVAIIPYWMVLLIGATLFFGKRLIWTPIVRRRRHRRGQCVACGYDMRGSPDRCPECGTASASHVTTGSAAT